MQTNEATLTKKRWPWQKGKDKITQPAQQLAPTQPTSFYEQAIEWTHRADKVINLVLGYLLAIASVLGFMDVLSDGQVLANVPYLFYVWLAIMGLGVDFQILLVIGRIPDLMRVPAAGWQKWLILSFNVFFLIFLGVMSIIISAIFTQHRDMTAQATISDAMGQLGINSIAFVYGRAALATLLLVLMAVDRTIERWRMQMTFSPADISNATSATIAEPAEAEPSLIAALAEMNKQNLLAIAEMNKQNLQAMQQMNSQRETELIKVTVEAVKAVLPASPATSSKYQLAEVAGSASPENETLPLAPSYVLDQLHRLLPGLAGAQSEDVLEVIKLYQEGLDRTKIQKALGWGSTKYSNIIKPVGDLVATGQVQLAASRQEIAESNLPVAVIAE